MDDAWSGRTVADVGERAVLARLREVAQVHRATVGSADPVVVGPGDDAATLTVPADLVVSTDTVVQDRHFRLEWTSAFDVGRRAATQAAADIAAMGAVGTGMVVSIGCPSSTPAGVVVEIDEGINVAASDWGVRVIGGDLVSTTEIVVTVTVLGTTNGRAAVRIDGARPGERLAVSGPLGSSAAGLAILSSAAGGYPDLVAAHRVPIVDLAQGATAADAGATSMTDVSDGLVEELITMAAAAGVGFEVDAQSIPTDPQLADAAGALGVDAVQWALGGGEDHQLLATFPAAVPDGWTVIGSVVEPAAAVDDRVRVDGRPPHVHGWSSFGDR
ncbi:thiamine-phosphate kinase [Williamsia deligens]|uniref:Thiamine-monophosphate kinase n=1 Tax=Williamsia deligens TaxID=321325 RepID=A0ABW3G580_9NOCA|nr:thiamine-phosphate kinase [Williamsia deligens]MCP2195084.1 thiamine-monophosphate kinase [Williamsia deligens]